MRALTYLLPLFFLVPLLLAPVPASPPLRSAMPAFWRFVEAAEQAPEERIPALFEQHLVKAHPELFVPEVLGAPAEDAEKRAASQLSYWKQIQPMLPEIRLVEREMEAVLLESEPLFRRHFPGFQLRTPVYIAPSLFRWDGAVRQVGDSTVMLFGPDGAAAFHGARARERLRPLMLHEFFHLSHAFEAEDPPDVLTMLWREGLASHASHVLLPQARLEDVLLSAELASLPREQEARLSQELLTRLTRSDEKARDAFFGYANAPIEEGIPVRAGYLLGYRVAQRLGKTRSLQELARLKRAELEPLIREALKELARGSSGGQRPPAAR